MADLEHYRTMRRSRRFEQVIEEQHDAGAVPGPLHLSIGQEAVAAGVCGQLKRDDVITSTHRGHHHCVAKGVDLASLMAELLGRKDGPSLGRGGSMHIAVPSEGLLGTNGIVGGGIPMATGAAFGFQVRGRSNVAVCFFGEGATSTGNFGEALNVAALWKLPVVFVCENNHYAELTPASVHIAGEIHERAAGYAMPGVRVDGNDVAAVSETTREAVERARAGDGPTLIEAVTYRWYGHYVGDKAAYRDENEVELGRAQDCLALTRERIAPAEADRIDAEVEAELAEALAFALASPEADAASLSMRHYAT